MNPERSQASSITLSETNEPPISFQEALIQSKLRKHSLSSDSADDFNDLTLPKENFFAFVQDLAESLKIRLPYNSMESLSQALSKLINNQIECSLLEITQVIDECYKAIRIFEDFGIHQSKIHIGKHEFSLSIVESDFLLAKKAEISRGFQACLNSAGILQEFPKSLLKLTENFEYSMQSAFDSSCPDINPQPQSCFVNKSQFLLDLQVKSAKSSRLQQTLIQSDMEFQRQESKLTKIQLKSKLHQIKSKELHLSEATKQLNTERILLTKERMTLEKAQEQLIEKREKLQSFIESLQRMINDLSDKPEISNLNSVGSNSSLPSIEPEADEDEQRALEQELSDLERQLINHPSEAPDSLRTQIARIKTRLSSIKTEKLISKTFQKSSNLKTVMTKVQKMMSIRPSLPHNPLTHAHRSVIPPIPFTQTLSYAKRSVLTPVPFSVSPVCNRPQTPQSPSELKLASQDLDPQTRSDGFKIQPDKENDSEYSKTRLLVVKEARLAAKEEELNKQEKWLKSNWDKKVDTKQALELVRAERMAMSRLRKEVEGREKVLESRLEEADREKEEFKKRSCAIDRKYCQIEAEHTKIANEREEFMQKVEEIKRFVQNFI